MFNQSDFPNLKSNSYLDSASTSLTPWMVIDAMDGYYENYRASPHRGFYDTAIRVTKEFEIIRKKVADFIDADESEVIFTSGSTHSSQVLISALEHNLDLQEGDEIIVTELDHHATLVPLQQLAGRKKMVVRVVPVDQDFKIDEQVFKDFLTPKTKIVSLIHASNVVGTINSVKQLTALAKRNNSFVFVDGAQTVGHINVSFKDINPDALFFSGHKMCGPTGVGALILKSEYVHTFTPAYGGGGTVESVSKAKTIFLQSSKKFEAGTPPIAEVIGLGAAIDYLRKSDVQKFKFHTDEIIKYSLDNLKRLPFLKVYAGESNIGVLALTIEGVHPHDVAHILAEEKVALRAGFQCAELISRKISENGIVRVSVYGYTDKSDIDNLILALEKVAKTFSL